MNTASRHTSPDPHDPEHAGRLLGAARTIAIVGFSANPDKPAHTAPMELVRRGWDIIPVNPTIDEVAGIPAVATLADIDRPVDIVDVFRPASEAADVARQAVQINAGAVWLQLGICSDEARELAREAGLAYVEDQCASQVARRQEIYPPAN